MEKQYAKFTMIDEDFTCDVCGSFVKALGYTARDHCPNCLCSKHVDINPPERFYVIRLSFFLDFTAFFFLLKIV